LILRCALLIFKFYVTKTILLIVVLFQNFSNMSASAVGMDMDMDFEALLEGSGLSEEQKYKAIECLARLEKCESVMFRKSQNKGDCTEMDIDISSLNLDEEKEANLSRCIKRLISIESKMFRQEHEHEQDGGNEYTNSITNTDEIKEEEPEIVVCKMLTPPPVIQKPDTITTKTNTTEYRGEIIPLCEYTEGNNPSSHSNNIAATTTDSAGQVQGQSDHTPSGFLLPGEVNSQLRSDVATSMAVDDTCIKEFKLLKVRRKHRYIVYTIDTGLIKVAKLGGRKETLEDFLSQLGDTACAYAVFDYEYKTSDGRLADKLLFITWCPRAANNTLKMLYTTERPRLAEHITGAFDLTASSHGDIKDYLGLDAGSDSDFDAEGDDSWLDD